VRKTKSKFIISVITIVFIGVMSDPIIGSTYEKNVCEKTLKNAKIDKASGDIYSILVNK